MKNILFSLLTLVTLPTFCQNLNFDKMDSLKIDSIALRWINTDSIHFDDEIIKEFGKIEIAKNRLLNTRISTKISYFKEKRIQLVKEIEHLRDSMITELQISDNLEYKVKIVHILFEIGDSTTTKFLFDNINIVYDPQVWHSDIWEQYPIAKLLNKHSYINFNFLKYIHPILINSYIDDPMDFFYASFLKNIFQNQDEFLYVYLHNLIRQYPNNSILKNNITSIKNSF